MGASLAIGLGTGWALTWLYRWRGIPATITAHATVNTVAAIALIGQACTTARAAPRPPAPQLIR